MTGVEVPDFHTLRNSRRSSFDISVYNSAVDTDRFHTMVRHLSNLSIQAQPTSFHRFLDGLAQNGCPLRHYSQIIDCIEHRLPDLWEKTVQLHGRIDEAMCQYCGWNGSFVPDFFCGSHLRDCNRCSENALERKRIGKRRRGIGRLRPNIVLTEKKTLWAVKLENWRSKIWRQIQKFSFVVGRTLKVPEARRLVTEICRAAKAQGGSTV